MRVLCVGRHQFLSEHLCRVFGELGAECEAAVGTSDASARAERFQPHVVVSDSDLLSGPLLDGWAMEPALHDVPVLAVSLTRRPGEAAPVPHAGIAGVIYLPRLDRTRALALLAAANRPRAVVAPSEFRVAAPDAPVAR